MHQWEWQSRHYEEDDISVNQCSKCGAFSAYEDPGTEEKVRAVRTPVDLRIWVSRSGGIQPTFTCEEVQVMSVLEV